MTNSKLLDNAVKSIAAVLNDLDEKLDMIQAEETHGAEWANQEDSFCRAKELLEEARKSIEQAEEYV